MKNFVAIILLRSVYIDFN